MKKELEIGGVTYTLIANREISDLFEKCVKVDAKGNAQIEAPSKKSVFNALLKTTHNLSMEDSNEILAKADEEYGIEQMNAAIDMMFNSVFTQSSPEKTISWLNDETENKKK